jgi:hypothetical protein
LILGSGQTIDCKAAIVGGLGGRDAMIVLYREHGHGGTAHRLSGDRIHDCPSDAVSGGALRQGCRARQNENDGCERFEWAREGNSAGAKANLLYPAFAARLKSCPDTRPSRISA